MWRQQIGERRPGGHPTAPVLARPALT
jgi:hypothetical protein